MGTETMKYGGKKPFWLQTKNPLSRFFFGPYVFFPLIAALTWCGGLLALVSLWARAGKPRYQGDEASVVFISDVGATYKTLFIIICCITGGFYILSLLAERWLRHVDRLPTDIRVREKIFDWLAIFFGIAGSAGLILLSIFDAFNHSTIHWSMTLVFIVGLALSAIFQSGEVWSLHKDHPDRKSLLRNSKIKLAIVGLAIATAIAFGVTYGICGGDATATGSRSAEQCNRITSAAGALEWTVAFILVFYFLTLVLDLWPAGKSSPRYMRRLARWQEKHGQGHDFTGRGAFDEYPERWVGNGTGEGPGRAYPTSAYGNGPAAGYGYTDGQVGNGYAATGVGAGAGMRTTPTAAELEERMRREMWERNAGVEGRASMASSQTPMMRQV